MNQSVKPIVFVCAQINRNRSENAVCSIEDQKARGREAGRDRELRLSGAVRARDDLGDQEPAARAADRRCEGVRGEGQESAGHLHPAATAEGLAEAADATGARAGEEVLRQACGVRREENHPAEAEPKVAHQQAEETDQQNADRRARRLPRRPGLPGRDRGQENTCPPGRLHSDQDPPRQVVANVH